MKAAYILLLLFFLIHINTSCHKSKPQLPTNKVQISKQGIELDKVNKVLVEREDSILHSYAINQNIDFHRNDAGFYYNVMEYTFGNFLQKNDNCIISYNMYLLDDTKVEEVHDKQITLGKNEVIKGIDLALHLLKRGENGIFLFPWTLAYGVLGNNTTIPPYTSVRVELSVR